jgi:hypothetical protein
MLMLNSDILHRDIPKTRSTHIHGFLVVIRLPLEVAPNVRKPAYPIHACCALEEGGCFRTVGSLLGEGEGGEFFGCGEEVGGVLVVVGVVYVIGD